MANSKNLKKVRVFKKLPKCKNFSEFKKLIQNLAKFKVLKRVSFLDSDIWLIFIQLRQRFIKTIVF